MLKSVFSKVITYTATAAISIFLPVFKSSAIQVSSRSPIRVDFYQDGFPNNGFLKGYIKGVDNDKDGYFNIFEGAMYDPDEDSDKLDRAFLSVKYSSDTSSIGEIHVDVSSTDPVPGSYAFDYRFRYSILSNELTGFLVTQWYGIGLSKGITCAGWDYWDDYECSSSPLVFSNISDNNNSGAGSSTQVPEPSLLVGFTTFSFVFFLKNKKKSKKSDSSQKFGI
jgi:hypothetical protein